MSGKRRDDLLTRDKKCPKCGEVKSPENFGPKKQKLKDGTIRDCLESWCRTCAQERKSKAYYANQEEAKAKDKIVRAKYRAKDPQKYRDWSRKFRLNHLPQRAEYQAEYYVRNPETYLYNSAKSRAKEKSVPFTITIEDIVISDHCPPCPTYLLLKEQEVTMQMLLLLIE